MTETSTVRPGVGAPPADDVLLDVRDLRTYFKVMDGTCRPWTAISFSLGRGQTLGIVGESGSGKSVTALTIMRLLDIPPAEIGRGQRDLVRRPGSPVAARTARCGASAATTWR